MKGERSNGVTPSLIPCPPHSDSIAVLVSTAAVRGSFLPTLSLHGVSFVSDSIVQRVKVSSGCYIMMRTVILVSIGGRMPGQLLH